MLERVQDNDSLSVMTGEGELAGQRLVFCPSGVLVLPALSLLVVSDLHLEKGSAFARRGLLLPPYDTAATLARLEVALRRHAPRTVISLGDSFHDRNGAAFLPDAYRDRLNELMRERDWIWVEGNHDPEPPEGLGGLFVSELEAGGLTFRHEPERGARHEVAGHLHPAARVTRRGKSVKRACFAIDDQRLMLPAFGSTAGGLDLSHQAFRGLFDRKSLHAHLIGRDRVYSLPWNRLSA